MATESEKTEAYKRGISGKIGARSGFSLRWPDKEEQKFFEMGKREKIRNDERNKKRK